MPKNQGWQNRSADYSNDPFGFNKAIQVDHLTNEELDQVEAVFAKLDNGEWDPRQSSSERDADRAAGRDS